MLRSTALPESFTLPQPPPPIAGRPVVNLSTLPTAGQQLQIVVVVVVEVVVVVTGGAVVEVVVVVVMVVVVVTAGSSSSLASSMNASTFASMTATSPVAAPQSAANSAFVQAPVYLSKHFCSLRGSTEPPLAATLARSPSIHLAFLPAALSLPD